MISGHTRKHLNSATYQPKTTRELLSHTYSLHSDRSCTLRQQFLLGSSRITVEVDAPSRGESIHLLSGIREFLHSSCQEIFWDESEVSSSGDVQPEIYSIWERISSAMFELQNLLELAKIDRDLVEISASMREIASDILKTLKDPDCELDNSVYCSESSADCTLPDYCGMKKSACCKERL